MLLHYQLAIFNLVLLPLSVFSLFLLYIFFVLLLNSWLILHRIISISKLCISLDDDPRQKCIRWIVVSVHWSSLQSNIFFRFLLLLFGSVDDARSFCKFSNKSLCMWFALIPIFILKWNENLFFAINVLFISQYLFVIQFDSGDDAHIWSLFASNDHHIYYYEISQFTVIAAIVFVNIAICGVSECK